MNKKLFKEISLIVLFFLIVIPLTQSFIFQESKKGKIEIEKLIEAKFLPLDSKEIVILFFGYYGCADVCSPILSQLSDIFESKKFKSIKRKVSFYFVNLTPQIKKEEAIRFAKYFNKEFNGVYLSKKEIMSIDREFDLYFAPSLKNKNELDHTSNLYLLKKEKENFVLLNSYMTSPLLDTELFLDDLKDLFSPSFTLKK